MSQSLLYHAFGVREGYEYQKTEYVEGRVEFHLRAKDELLKCPDCGHQPARRRGRRWRRIRTTPIGLKEVVLVTEVPRCQCQQCGKTFDVSPLLPQPIATTPTASRASSVRSAGG
jgi:transposase